MYEVIMPNYSTQIDKARYEQIKAMMGIPVERWGFVTAQDGDEILVMNILAIRKTSG